MAMFDFNNVNVEVSNGSTQRLAANKVHNVILKDVALELKETKNGPSNIIRILFEGVDGEDKGATFEHLVFEPRPEDFKGMEFEGGGTGASGVERLQYFLRHFLMAVSPAYKQFIETPGTKETYASWEAWRQSVLKFAKQGIGKPVQIKLFGRIDEKDGRTYVNATFPTYFLGTKKDGGRFMRTQFIGHDLKMVSKYDTDQIAKTANQMAAKPTSMPTLTNQAEDTAAERSAELAQIIL